MLDAAVFAAAVAHEAECVRRRLARDERVEGEELASFGMDFWPQEAIESALGADLADAIPELLRLADLEVRIPSLEILAPERLADREGKSVDAVLARELLDVVSANSEYLATAIPGYAELRWPQ